MRSDCLFGISPGFPELSPSYRQVAYVLLTRPPLTSREQALLPFARLACIRHAASVRPEPGSNSPINCDNQHYQRVVAHVFLNSLGVLFSFQRTIFYSVALNGDFYILTRFFLFVNNFFQKVFKRKNRPSLSSEDVHYSMDSLRLQAPMQKHLITDNVLFYAEYISYILREGQHDETD